MIEQNIYKLEKFVKRSSKPPVQTVTQFSSLTKNSKLVTTELPSFEIICKLNNDQWFVCLRLLEASV